MNYSDSTVSLDPASVALIRDNGGNQNAMLNSGLNAKINIKASDKRGEYAEYGINPPEIADGMIPVVYNEETGN